MFDGSDAIYRFIQKLTVRPVELESSGFVIDGGLLALGISYAYGFCDSPEFLDLIKQSHKLHTYTLTEGFNLCNFYSQKPVNRSLGFGDFYVELIINNKMKIQVAATT